MSLEGFSKRGMELGNNPERINETKNDLRQQYIDAIERLALLKMRNDILFEGMLGAAMRNLSSLGLDISRESMLKDINTEVNKQMYGINFDMETPTYNLSQEDKAKEESRRIEEIFQRLFEEENERVSVEDIKTVLASFSDPKAITPSQIGESTVQAGTGITDINKTTQEMRKDLQPEIEKTKEFDD